MHWVASGSRPNGRERVPRGECYQAFIVTRVLGAGDEMRTRPVLFPGESEIMAIRDQVSGDSWNGSIRWLTCSG